MRLSWLPWQFRSQGVSEWPGWVELLSWFDHPRGPTPRAVAWWPIVRAAMGQWGGVIAVITLISDVYAVAEGSGGQASYVE